MSAILLQAKEIDETIEVLCRAVEDTDDNQFIKDHKERNTVYIAINKEVDILVSLLMENNIDLPELKKHHKPELVAENISELQLSSIARNVINNEPELTAITCEPKLDDSFYKKYLS